MARKAQGSLEYIVLIGAVLFFIVLVVVVTKTNVLSGGSETAQTNMQQYTATNTACSLGVPCPSGYECAANGSCVPTACTAISSCTPVDSPGIYCLTSDLTATDGYCINVTVSDVEIDCRSHLITGATPDCGFPVLTAGIGTDNAVHNLTVKNCRITNASAGIGIGYHPGGSVNAGSFSNNVLYGNCYGVGGFINASSITNNNASYNLGFGFALPVGTSANTLNNNLACGNLAGGHYEDFRLAANQSGNTESTCDVNGCREEGAWGLCTPDNPSGYSNCTHFCP